MMIDIEELKKVSLNASDIVVITTKKSISLTQVERLKKSWKDFVSGNKIVVFEPGTKFEVIETK